MLNSEQLDLLKSKSILVATVVISGSVMEEYATSHEEMRVLNERNGFTKVEYIKQTAVLVEAGRQAVVEHALKNNYDAILQIDADMAGFPPDAMLRLLERLFITLPHADVVGAYCNLRGVPHLPTIDTGTGTWESHFPGGGVLEVIRTGTAFLMCKTSAFRLFGPPWFRTKTAERPIDGLITVDNMARMWLDGTNPFYNTNEWQSLREEAKKRSTPEGTIGEDSGFCDRLRAAGGRIFVDTDLVTGHVGKKIIEWTDHKRLLDDYNKNVRLAVGVTGA